MAVALVPGSFDPPTNGHIDVIERAARHFERVIVSVVVNPSKNALFNPQERIALLREALTDLTNVEVLAHEGLTVALASERGADVIVRGLRAVSDLEYELQMAQMNASLEHKIDTLFIPPDPRWSFISSSLVKEVARFGGDVSDKVPKGVFEALTGRFS